MKRLCKSPLASLLGNIAIGALIAIVLAGCVNPTGGGENKPEQLTNSATADQALAVLDELIAYPETPAATKAAAEALKNNWSSYSGDWNSNKTTMIAQINNLVDTIPSPSGGSGDIDSALVAKWHSTQKAANDGEYVVFEFTSRGILTGDAFTAGVIKVTTSKGRISSTTTLNGITTNTGSVDYVVRGTELRFSNPSSGANIFSSLIADQNLGIALGGAGCYFKKAGGNNNTDPKSRVLTGVDANQASQIGSLQIGIFPVGTSVEDALVQKDIVAGADEGNVKLSSSSTTVTVELYAAPNYTSRWRGSGTYDVFAVVGSGRSASYYRARNVSFTSTSTGISIERFEEVFINGSGNGNGSTVAKTLVITGINTTQVSSDIQIGIFPVGTSLDDALSQKRIVAGADKGNVKLSPSGPLYTATVELYAAPDYRSRWTDSGSYDVYVVLSSNGHMSVNFYRARNVSFTYATTEVSAAGFSEIMLPPQKRDEQAPETGSQKQTEGSSGTIQKQWKLFHRTEGSH
jgi:hypothetical protein